MARVYGVGVGPGDPRLLTLAAVDALSSSSLVVAPLSSAASDGIALDAARPHIAEACKVARVVFPMSELAEDREPAAVEAAGLLADRVRSGEDASFITLGDPSFYSTWGYVAAVLKRDHPDVAVTVVPGVSAPFACAAALGEPLAEGREPLLVWPDTPPEDLGDLLEIAPNIVALKAGRNIQALLDAAEAADASVSAVRRCTSPEQIVAHDAADLLGEKPDYLTTAFVHQREQRATQQERVKFVGAGPGAPDLITVRGRRALREADVVVWAGSLVPREVLRWTRSDAEIHDSGEMNLAEQVGVMARSWRAGKRVVRLHTGDPAIFGATAEQWDLLDAEGVPYEVVPGVSSLFAAAAALPAELTRPGVSQAVIVCRAPGRTPVPEGQSVGDFAAHGATLAVFLSAGLGSRVAEELAPHYAPTTPVAIVQRASWPEQRVVRCTVGTLEETLVGSDIDRTAIVLVGDALAPSASERSRLYDAAFSHGYREADTPAEEAAQ